MLSDFMKESIRRQLTEQLIEARRHLREQEKRLAQLKYEWNIAKRLRHQAPNEDEREKWRVQSDAYLGLVLQQEEVMHQIKESIDRHQSQLTELDADAQLPDEAEA